MRSCWNNLARGFRVPPPLEVGLLELKQPEILNGNFWTFNAGWLLIILSKRRDTKLQPVHAK